MVEALRFPDDVPSLPRIARCAVAAPAVPSRLKGPMRSKTQVLVVADALEISGEHARRWAKASHRGQQQKNRTRYSHAARPTRSRDLSAFGPA